MALRKIASMWKRESGGKTVLSGKTEREAITIPPNVKILMFANTDKGGNEKRPDFTLHIAEDDQPEATPSREVWGGQAPAADLSDDETPF